MSAVDFAVVGVYLIVTLVLGLSMLAGFLVGLATSLLPVLVIADFGARLTVIALVTAAAIWVPVMPLTPPERDGNARRLLPARAAGRAGLAAAAAADRCGAGDRPSHELLLLGDSPELG